MSSLFASFSNPIPTPSALMTQETQYLANSNRPRAAGIASSNGQQLTRFILQPYGNSGGGRGQLPDSHRKNRRAMQDTLRLLCVHNHRRELEEKLVQRNESFTERSHREMAGDLIDRHCLFDRQWADTATFESKEMSAYA